MGRDPDLVGARIAVVADHRPHRVGAVEDVVAGCVRGVTADVLRIEPVVVVVHGAVGVMPAVLVDQGRVIPLDSGIDAADGDAFTAIAVGVPDQRRVDIVDVPLDSLDPGRAAFALDRLRDLVGLVRQDLVDLGLGRQLVDQLLVPGHPDRIHDPVGSVADPPRREH